MVYEDLTNDALLEIGMYLDYYSIVSWAQVSGASRLTARHIDKLR